LQCRERVPGGSERQDSSVLDGAVWYFCRRLLHTAFLKEYGSEPPDLTRTEEDPAAKHLHEAFRSPTATCSVVPLAFKFFSSARIVEQQGRFTMCLKVHQDHVCIATKIARTHLKKIVIPHKIKPDFLAELRRMNITRGRAVPGSRRLGSIHRRADLTRHAARPHVRPEYQLTAYLRCRRVAFVTPA